MAIGYQNLSLRGSHTEGGHSKIPMRSAHNFTIVCLLLVLISLCLLRMLFFPEWAQKLDSSSPFLWSSVVVCCSIGLSFYWMACRFWVSHLARIKASKSRSQFQIRCFFILCITIFVAVIVSFKLETERKLAKHAAAYAEAVKTGNALQLKINALTSTGHALTGAIRHQPHSNIDIESFAVELLSRSPAVNRFQLAPGGITSKNFPPVGNYRIDLGQNLFEDANRKAKILSSIRFKEFTLLELFQLEKGGFEIEGCVPTFISGSNGRESLWGLIIVSLSLDSSFQKTHLDPLKKIGYEYALVRRTSSHNESNMLSQSSSLSDKKYATYTIALSTRNGYFHLCLTKVGARRQCFF